MSFGKKYQKWASNVAVSPYYAFLKISPSLQMQGVCEIPKWKIPVLEIKIANIKIDTNLNTNTTEFKI